MARRLVPRFFLYLLDVVAFVVCCLGIVHIAAKPGLPISFESRRDTVRCNRVDSELLSRQVREGDALLQIDGRSISNPEDVEFLLDGLHVGDQVSLLCSGPEGDYIVKTSLQHYYGVPYLCTVIFVSTLFFGVGLVVFWRRPDDPAARVYHLGSIGTAVMLSTTWGSYLGTPPAIGVVLRMTFSTAYAFVPLLFFHFMRLFPHPNPTRWRGLLPLLYTVSTILAAGTAYSFAVAWQQNSVLLFHTHLGWFSATRSFMVLLVSSGLWSIRQSHLLAENEAERRKLRWVAWGLFIGFLPFVVLWVVPQMLLSYAIVPEGVMLLASGFIPLAFGISIVKYQIMDIDLLFNRSIVYGTATAIVILVFVTIVGGMAAFVSSATNELSIGISTAAAVIVALLFEPARRMTQHQVDRRFFRIKYDFRLAERQFQEDIKACISAEDMCRLFAERIDALLLPERVAVILLREDQPASIPQNRGFDLPDPSLLAGIWEEVTPTPLLPLAKADFIEPGTQYTPASAGHFLSGQLALAHPIPSPAGKVLGFLFMGPKRSQTRFSHEDVDLLGSLATHVGLEVERTLLQRQIMEKANEAERLQRLNTLKSDFVSYVSHELRTPLTSIRMFAELLVKRLPRGDRNAREYVGIIEGESDRLQRMVNTILDSAKIDTAEQHYSLRTVDLEKILRGVLKTLRYQLAKEKFTVKLSAGKSLREGFAIFADPDAVREAALNLLSNAMKYSWEQKQIRIVLERKGGAVRCSVIDHGRGISREAQDHLFEKFYRDPSLPRRIQGVGLGLSVVKHIMDAHNGAIEVVSKIGTGSAFTLVFPAAKMPAKGRGRNTKN